MIQGGQRRRGASRTSPANLPIQTRALGRGSLGLRWRGSCSKKGMSRPNTIPDALSYRAYTVSELDSLAPAASSLETTSLDVAPSATAPWKTVGSSALVVLRAAWSWWRAGRTLGLRAPIMTVLSEPLAVLREDLALATARVDWRKVGVGTAAAMGTFGVLLFAVLTAAELTDDLKPARSSVSRASGGAYTTAIVEAAGAPAAAVEEAEPVEATASAVPAAAAAAHVAPARSGIEGAYFAADPPPKAARARPPKAKKKRPAKTELFVP